MKAIEEHAYMLGQGFMVERPCCLELRGARVFLIDLLGMKDERWVVLDARRRANVFGELWEIMLGNSAHARLLKFFLDTRALLLVGHCIDQPLEIDPVVPSVQRRHEGILRHVLPV